MWEDKFKDEFAKTGPLEVVCNALREELDAAHKERIQAFEIKMQPIIIRDGPSKKVSFLPSLCQHLVERWIKKSSIELESWPR